MDDFENNLSASLNFLFLLSTLVFVVLETKVRENGFKNNFQKLQITIKELEPALHRTTVCRLKEGVHISAHVHESKCFFLFLINFMALTIPLTCTSVITIYN